MTTTTPAQQVADTAQSEMTAVAPIAAAVIAAGAVLAFGIKGIWVAWNAASKATGKAGT